MSPIFVGLQRGQQYCRWLLTNDLYKVSIVGRALVLKTLTQLQRDINILYLWSLNNKMKFHPDECEVVTIKQRQSPLAMLPIVAYHYQLAETLLSHADSEKDLGVHVNKSFNFNEHCENILTKANQKFGVLKRTCHFVTHSNRRRVLYLALVRSQFEHCSPVWRPCSSTLMNKFEVFQKNASSGFSLNRNYPTQMKFI